MKKNNLFAVIILLPFLMLFNSCFSPVFYEIRKDVKPESATVSGNIPQITRYTLNGEEYIFASANGGLRYKKADNQIHGSWATMAVPFTLLNFNYDTTKMNGAQLIGVFANSETLYLIAATFSTEGSEGKTNPSKIEIWASNTPDIADSWSQINKDSSIDYFPFLYDSVNEVYKANYNVFQTNTPKKVNRHAYICSYIKNEDGTSGAYKCFELSGTSIQPVSISKPEDAEAGNRVYSAAYFKGEVRFFTSKAVVTDETNSSDAKNIYYADGDGLYYYSSASAAYVKACSTGTVISTLATTKDSIIIGLGNLLSLSTDAGGIKRVLRAEDGTPGSATVSFETNADFQISTAYNVLSLLNTTPEKEEKDSILYASITFSGYDGIYDNIGIWSYYPTRGNWNRE